MKQIAIIGGGLSGALAAAALLRMTDNCSMRLFECKGVAGHGTAYAPGYDSHQVNGPACGLTADTSDPNHLANWLERLRSNGLAPSALDSNIPAGDLFPPRWLFGRYIEEILASAVAGREDRFQLIQAEVVDLIHAPTQTQVLLADGVIYTADHVILATGLQFRKPNGPRSDDLIHPWQMDRMMALSADAHVAIVGAGLSMIDGVASLAEAGHQGPITVFSRRGMRPHPRRLPIEWADYLDDTPDRIEILYLYKRVVRECRRAIAEGTDWQAPLDLVRGHIPRWWSASDDTQRSRFLRHVRTIWETHHHRSPPLGNRRFEQAVAAGRLQHRAATVHELSSDSNSGQITITFAVRGQQQRQQELFDAVLVSSGIEYDWRRITMPLAVNLLKRGTIRPGPMNLGLDALHDGRLLDREGRPQDWLIALGPPLRGIWWESTAIPDITRQAEQIAAMFAGSARP